MFQKNSTPVSTCFSAWNKKMFVGKWLMFRKTSTLPSLHSFQMKVASSNVKELQSFYKPMRFWFGFGWLLGIFPMSYDKTLAKFKFKFFSLTTFFSICRILLIFLAFFLPNIIRTFQK